MTATIDLDHDVITAPPARRGPQPWRIWLPVLAGVAVLVAGAVAYATYEPQKPTPAVVLKVDAGGDVARSVAVARMVDGTIAPINAGEGTYTSIAERSQLGMVSVTVVSGFGTASCTIAIDGVVVDTQAVEGGGEVAVCTWSAPRPQ